jgi:hypothetical protein
MDVFRKEIAYFAYGLQTGDCLDLGYAFDEPGIFQGPLVWFDDLYILPDEYRMKLMRAYTVANLPKGMVVGRDTTVFDNNPFHALGDMEYCPVVGGETPDDVPVSKYLPEFADDETRSRIKRASRRWA